MCTPSIGDKGVTSSEGGRGCGGNSQIHQSYHILSRSSFLSFHDVQICTISCFVCHFYFEVIIDIDSIREKIKRRTHVSEKRDFKLFQKLRKEGTLTYFKIIVSKESNSCVEQAANSLQLDDRFNKKQCSRQQLGGDSLSQRGNTISLH